MLNKCLIVKQGNIKRKAAAVDTQEAEAESGRA